MALLRLAGTWRPGPAPTELELVAVSAGDRVPLSPLPAGPAKPGDRLWRAAYSLSPQLLGAAFELDRPHDAPIPLPAPVEHGASPDPEAAPEREVAPVAPAAPEARRRFRRRRPERTAAVPPQRQAGREEPSDGDALESVRKELEVVRRTLAAELDAVRRQLESTQAQLDAANRHIDTVNEAHALEVGSARTQRDHANARSDRLEGGLRDTHAEIGSLRDRLADREDLVERARAEAARAAEETAELEAAAARLHDAIAERAREAAASPPRRFSRDSPAPELERAREELRAGAERIQALEDQAQALREAIRSGLPPSVDPSPLQEALPLDP